MQQDLSSLKDSMDVSSPIKSNSKYIENVHCPTH